MKWKMRRATMTNTYNSILRYYYRKSFMPSVALYGGCIGYILILQRDILRHSRPSNFTRCLKHVNAGGRLDCKVPALNNYI